MSKKFKKVMKVVATIILIVAVAWLVVRTSWGVPGFSRTTELQRNPDYAAIRIGIDAVVPDWDRQKITSHVVDSVLDANPDLVRLPHSMSVHTEFTNNLTIVYITYLYK
ncbi:MAG: hypothetical protein WC495_02600 [Patescibacteria group bacterium]